MVAASPTIASKCISCTDRRRPRFPLKEAWATNEPFELPFLCGWITRQLIFSASCSFDSLGFGFSGLAFPVSPHFGMLSFSSLSKLPLSPFYFSRFVFGALFTLSLSLMCDNLFCGWMNPFEKNIKYIMTKSNWFVRQHLNDNSPACWICRNSSVAEHPLRKR